MGYPRRFRLQNAAAQRSIRLSLIAEMELARHVANRAAKGRLRRLIFERDGFVCRYCGTTVGPFEVDHVIPFSRGGRTIVENLRVACRECNREKAAHAI